MLKKTLRIRDTGIGIAPEDLPRVFENGYTGYNGRADKKASGIGLYLCKRICNNLGHTITARSTVDVGTIIDIDLAQTKLEVEWFIDITLMERFKLRKFKFVEVKIK